MSSVEALIYYSKKYPKSIHGIFMGPLTNLALAFLIDNDFPSRLASINIIRSDRTEKTIKNISDYAASNSWCDPLAYVILKECISKINVPIRIVDLAMCLAPHLPLSFLDNIKNLNRRASKMNKHLDLFEIFIDRTNQYSRKIYQENGIIVFDLYAAAGLFNLSLWKTVKRVNIVNVVKSGQLQGQVEYQEDSQGSVDLFYEFETDQMAEKIVDTISRAGILLMHYRRNYLSNN
ncbi:hypothetical protein RF11_02524 [Thelohanellus kitauei]|uniref:Inosine/uridine-preferring nucleoside hydrolase domain-containing protein n=1 Tax=Thelohanellus kitauei TaxID=669202 RepID=A0A0C2JQI4_THEKT|nr:hypothetical protein RF11_02524 [Thelohanellus kitauei]